MDRHEAKAVNVDSIDLSELKAELEKHHRSSFGWALSCCRHDRSEAEEVLQTVYLKILEEKARFAGKASFKTWLFAVIRKTAAEERRRSVLRKLLRSTLSSQEGTERIARPEEIFERSMEQKRFRQALKKLPARQREALHLVFYEDLSLREAAEAMGVSIGSARRHYERGKRRLREILERTEVVYGIRWRGKQNPGVVS
jgi:RNA polymerase sigma-70 factor (ECF subfamily)